MAQTRRKRNKKNALHCELCAEGGYRADHKESDRCYCFCSHCKKPGHHMSVCYKLKFCNLCNKAGHNPYRCWEHWSISHWIDRAKDLNRCILCLAQPTLETKYKDKYGCPRWCCKHCGKCWDQSPRPQVNCKESQTEDNIHLVQACETELQEGKAIIDNQKRQIEDLNRKILSLENKLENSNAIIDSLDWKLQSIIKEKEQELQKVSILDSMCKDKELELRRLQEQICQKDIELDQHRKTSAQPYQTIPATVQQPCLTPTSNHLEQINETNFIKATLINLQDQQQKLSVIVNHLYNNIKTQDMHWLNYSSFNPYLGPYDTGQFFNKLQQV